MTAPGTRPPSKSPMAGGSLLAFSLLAGALIGTLQGQPTIGILAGLGVGLLLLAAVFLWDRRR